MEGECEQLDVAYYSFGGIICDQPTPMEAVGLLADELLIWQGFLIGSFQLDVEPLCVAMKVLTSWTIHFPVAKVNLSVHILLGRWLIGCSHLSNSVLVI